MDWRSIESRPGSFSKNFGWGDGDGLGLLHRAINAIFKNGLEPVTRDTARKRISEIADGDPLIPVNFFLYNQIIGSEDYIVPDQLVFEALSSEHSQSFDRVAMCALNFSRVGKWRSARSFQAHPAPWARNFVIDELWNGNSWEKNKITSDIIERYFDTHLVYEGGSPRKYATNLHFLYQQSSMIDLSSAEREDWWSSALFLFLDRSMLDGEIKLRQTADEVVKFIQDEDFFALTAVDPSMGIFAAYEIVREYLAMDGIERLMAPSEDVDVKIVDKLIPSEMTKVGSVSRKVSSSLKKPDDFGLTLVQRTYAHAQKQIRNRTHANWVKKMYEDRCAICGEALVVDARGETYSEAGHVKPVGKPFEGPDHLTNILSFCPNHHKAFDRGGVWIDPCDGNPLVYSSHEIEGFHGRRLELIADHGFNLEFVEWHAKYFGHLS